jgi:LPPG:FO 2-phospho-L-lactate transferase
MAELGIPANARSILPHYAGLIDGFVIDSEDKGLAEEIGLSGGPDARLPTLVTNTMMRTLDDKVTLARQCLAFCAELSRASAPRHLWRARSAP